MADTVDPLAGSYFVESMTNSLEEKAWQYLKQIEDIGGAVAAVENGVFQKEIAQTSYETQQSIESGEQVVVGVNSFTDGNEDQSLQVFRVDRRVVEEQRLSLERTRGERSAEDVGNALTELRAVAQGEGDLMPPILAAVRAYATTGEICGALRDVFGEYTPPIEV